MSCDAILDAQRGISDFYVSFGCFIGVPPRQSGLHPTYGRDFTVSTLAYMRYRHFGRCRRSGLARHRVAELLYDLLVITGFGAFVECQLPGVDLRHSGRC